MSDRSVSGLCASDLNFAALAGCGKSVSLAAAYPQRLKPALKTNRFIAAVNRCATQRQSKS
jgi:hypothetical protein